MSLIGELYNSFQKNKSRRAFCIDGKDISYGEFQEYIEGSRELLSKRIKEKNQPVGIVTFETIETYAAFFACWFNGHYFIPVNPKHPVGRNMEIIRETGIKYVLTCRDKTEKIIQAEKIAIFNNAGVKSQNTSNPCENNYKQRLYILTTSGSTGIPKYVPTNQGNAEAYCEAYLKEFPELGINSNVVQVHEHTTDASFTSYLIPLLAGACVYTLPESPFKFPAIARMIADKSVNWVKLTPSVLAYLDPYIDKLDLSHIRHFGFGGEALPVAMLQKWWAKFPDAKVTNFYGPTEGTMNSTFYKIDKEKGIKEQNGIVSIGKPFAGVGCTLLDKKNQIAPPGAEGELCLAGKQVMEGYLKNESNPFILIEQNRSSKKYYRTGDLAVMDANGYYYFTGRADDQVKVEGFRVNLIEVENAVRKMLPETRLAVAAYDKLPGLKRLYLFLEGSEDETENIKEKLNNLLPGHMIPEKVFSVPGLPFTSSGKIDRQKLCYDYLYNKD